MSNAIIKKYTCLTCQIGTIFLSSKKFTVHKSFDKNDRSGTIIATTQDEVNAIEGSQQFAKGNVYEKIDQISAERQQTDALYDEKIRLIGLLFSEEELVSFSTLPDDLLGQIRDTALATKDEYLESQEGTAGEALSGNATNEDTEDAKDNTGATDGTEGKTGDGEFKLPAYDDITARELREYLTSKNIPFDDKAFKKELYELVEKSLVPVE